MNPLEDFLRLIEGVDLEPYNVDHEVRQVVCAHCTWIYPPGVDLDSVKGHCDIFHPGAEYAITAELMPVIPSVRLKIEPPTTRPTSTSGQPRPADPVPVKDDSTPTTEGSAPDVASTRPGTPRVRAG